MSIKPKNGKLNQSFDWITRIDFPSNTKLGRSIFRALSTTKRHHKRITQFVWQSLTGLFSDSASSHATLANNYIICRTEQVNQTRESDAISHHLRCFAFPHIRKSIHHASHNGCDWLLCICQHNFQNEVAAGMCPIPLHLAAATCCLASLNPILCLVGSQHFPCQEKFLRQNGFLLLSSQ